MLNLSDLHQALVLPRASEAELKENRGRLEVELQQKAEELTAVTLEQHQIAQYWKGKWQETLTALNAKEKELRLAIVKHSQKNEKHLNLEWSMKPLTSLFNL
eukprot:g29784.t1